MTREQSTDVFKTAKNNSGADQARAGETFQDWQNDLQSYRGALADYQGSDPYKAGGEFDEDSKTIIGSRASADSAALGHELNAQALRSGENTANFAPTLAKATRDATLDAQTTQADADQKRLASDTAYRQQGMAFSQFPVTAESNMTGAQLGGANQSLSTAGSAAAANKSFGDVFGQAFAADLANAPFKVSGTSNSDGSSSVSYG